MEAKWKAVAEAQAEEITRLNAIIRNLGDDLLEMAEANDTLRQEKDTWISIVRRMAKGTDVDTSADPTLFV